MFKEQDASTMQSLLQNDIASYAQDAVDNGAAPRAAGIQKVLEIQRDWILNKGVGMSENFDYSFGACFQNFTKIAILSARGGLCPHDVLS